MIVLQILFVSFMLSLSFSLNTRRFLSLLNILMDHFLYASAFQHLVTEVRILYSPSFERT